LHAGVEGLAGAAVGDWRACGERRQDGQDEPHRGVQPGEFGVVGEGQVEVHALQVGLAVLPAAEDAVVRPVDRRPGVRPQLRVGRGVHPGMHGGGHEARAEGSQRPVDAPDFGLKACDQRLERGVGAGVLDFDEVQHDLVGPGEVPVRDRRQRVPRRRAQQAVGDRHDREGLPVDDHVLQLDAVAPEGVQRGRRIHRAAPSLRASMRRKNEPMISR
jgi:hypothetical protein